MTKSKLLLPFLLVGAVILISGCTNNNQNNNFEELIANIHQDGKFIFEDLTWLLDRDEVMELKDLSEDNTQQGSLDYLSKPIGAFDMDDGSLEQTVVYILSENKKDSQFVSGEYRLYTPDKELFVEFANKLKTYLSDSLTEPYGNDLSVLEQADDVSNQPKRVLWEGSDGSMLTTSINTIQTEDEETKYLLVIKTGAPIPDEDSLE